MPLMTSVLLGIGFEFPLLLLILLRMRVIKRQQIRICLRWIYLGTLIFAILLPADSILADILLALPLIILFELTLILSRVQLRNKKEQPQQLT